ncbi:hypothetical protein AB0J38_14420 [Streptomyces sp. NPDC050095]|uniref:hypothetical protein n=1 Tax=unclassified Streptomyces TaxID=2593676 RepID=UPI0034440150
MRGCITDDFTLARGRILGLRGPVPGARTRPESGLFRDALGLRRGTLTEGALNPVTVEITHTTNPPPTMSVGQLWKIPMPQVRLPRPQAVRAWMWFGFWTLSWSANLPANVNGTTTMWADPTHGSEGPPQLRPVSRRRNNAMTKPTVWAGAETWPVTQIANSDDASIDLFLNAHIENQLLAQLTLTHYRMAFTGFTAPVDGARPLTIDEALTRAVGADTIQAAFDAATATTVHTVVEEWSNP